MGCGVNRLVETFLAQRLSLSWPELPAEADRLRPVLGMRLEGRLDRVLGYARSDPFLILGERKEMEAEATVRANGFGELEAVVMDRIWEREGTTTVRQIFNGLAAHRDIAYTTVMSTMDNLHRKGWLARVRTGKAFTYWPTLSREQHTARLMREVFDAGGQADLVLTHFVEQMSAEESASLRQALRRLAADEDTS